MRTIAAVIIALLLSVTSLLAEDRISDEKHPPETYRAEGLINLTPQNSPEVNTAGVILFDLIVPGGGHFYRGDYFNGILFASLKVPAYYSLYYFYKEMEYRESLYLSAKSAANSLDPHKPIYFKDPDGGYKTAGEFKQSYERASQNLVFSAAANVLICAASIIVNINALDMLNESAIPSFYYSSGFADEQTDHKIIFCYDTRF
jgi:hypothetical protein